MTDDTGDVQWYHLSVIEEQQRRLERKPNDIAGWLRLADMWMVKGNFLRASSAYGKIIARDPTSLAALRGRADALRDVDPLQSMADFARVAELEANSTDKETAVGNTPSPLKTNEDADVYFDITDMIEYLGVNSSFSGIQRVVANLLRQGAKSHGVGARTQIHVIIPDFMENNLYEADIRLVLELIDAIELHNLSREHINRLLHSIKQSLRLVRPEPGSIFLMAGAFWISYSYDLLKELREKRIVVSVFIHDLIQINNADYVERAATDAFRRSLVDVLELSNFLTTNSEFVAREVRRFLRDELDLEKPVQAVPLATEMNLAPRDIEQEKAIISEMPNGYVLCVCTIEVRKNHIYLARIWQRLTLAGFKRIPTLVLVGKWGWEIEPFRRYLTETNNLGGLIRVMSGVSDALLVSLYRAALFTIYPSFAEGWGLPVGESLVLGTPCIASATTSIPEVGRNLVRYLDPLDVDTGFAQVAALLENPADLAAWRSQIREQFRPRSWSVFAETLLAVSRSLAVATGSEPQPSYARIRSGEFAVVGHQSVVRAAGFHETMRTARMARQRGWFRIDEYGAWALQPVSTLAFEPVGSAPGTRVRLVLEFLGEKGPQQLRIIFEAGSGQTETKDVLPGFNRYTVDALVAEDGLVHAQISVLGGPIRFEDRDVYVRLTRLGFYLEDRQADRLALMERALMPV